MALRANRQASIGPRRVEVARARARCLTLREIVVALAEKGLRNPDTDEPWGLTTVHSDCKALDAQWRKAALQETSTHKARILSELNEVKRAAWVGFGLDNVLKALGQERAMLGVDAPVKIAPTTPDGQNPYAGASDEQLRQQLAEIHRAVAGGGALPLDTPGEAEPTPT